MPLSSNLSKCRASLTARARATAVAAAVLLVAATATASAQSAPFAKFAGAWSGSGRISFADGRSERLRCRAQYAVGGGGTAVQQTLRCASDSYNFQLQSNVQSNGGTLVGNWSEATRNIGGTLSGRAAGGRIQVRATSPTFSVGLTLTTSGNRQSVTIHPESQADITGATIQLTRHG